MSTLDAMTQDIEKIPGVHKVETPGDKHKCIKLKFHHAKCKWSVKIPREYPNKRATLRKKTGTLFRSERIICEFTFPFDVCEELKKHCQCPICSPSKNAVSPMNPDNVAKEATTSPERAKKSARQDEPVQLLSVSSSNHGQTNREHYNDESDLPVPSSTEHQQWYDTDEGMTRLQKIQSNSSKLVVNSERKRSITVTLKMKPSTW